MPNHSSDSKYCGTKSPKPYVSQGNQIKIIFAADPIGEGRSGFYATYSAGAENCGGTFWTEKGQFSNPGYSAGKYPPNLDCAWTVKSSPGNKVKLDWSGAEIENSDSCVKDYLKVYLYDESGPLVKISCQETVQNPNIFFWLGLYQIIVQVRTTTVVRDFYPIFLPPMVWS